MGKVGDVEFKATGKEILQPGWRVVYALDQVAEEAKEKDDEEKVLPAFVKGGDRPSRTDADREADHATEILHRGHAPACHGDGWKIC